MESNSFKSDEIRATWNRSWNSGRPRRIISDHKTVTPEAIENCPIDKPRLVDLELKASYLVSSTYMPFRSTNPFKRVRVHAGTGSAGTFSHVDKLIRYQLQIVKEETYVNPPLGHTGEAKCSSTP